MPAGCIKDLSTETLSLVLALNTAVREHAKLCYCRSLANFYELPLQLPLS